MRRFVPAWLLLASPLLGALSARAGADPQVVRPYEAAAGFVPATPIDVCVLAALRERGIEPANLCSDETFLRRVHLDLLGTLPEPSEARAFLRDAGPDKRARLVDALLRRDDELAAYAGLLWGDVLRIKAEYPINLWPNAVQAYDRWIRDALRENRPFDRVAREMLTSSGSNFRVPPVNFWRAVSDRSPAGLAAAVALTFLGERFERWPKERRDGFAALFSRVAFKKTAEWKEEIVLLDPAPAGPLDAVLPDGTPVRIEPDRDPRAVFADWLLAPGNPRFARGLANRVWARLLGRGVVHEADDLRPDNPPSNPALLECLERSMTGLGYDLRAFQRLVLTSRTYQASPIPRSDRPEGAALFAHFAVRPLAAEVLHDALVRLDGVGEEYSSVVPEPYTFLPRSRRSIELADGSITSSFLETFGRPARDTGLLSERSPEPTDAQRLFLLNSSEVRNRIARSPRLRQFVEAAGPDRRTLLDWIFLNFLGREPTDEERQAAESHFGEERLTAREAVNDLVWALVNSKEFLHQH